MMLNISLILLALSGPIFAQHTWAASAENGPGPAAETLLLLAQRKPHDRGNCFQWKGCRGDSIGMLWVHAADYCKTMGGKSWMDVDGQCYNLPDGPHNIVGPNN